MTEREEIDNKLAKWLELEGWQVQKLNEPNYYSLYKVTQSENSGCMVGIEKVIDRVNILARVSFGEDERKIYLLSPDKLKFWIELKINLMLLGIGTQIEPLNDPTRLKSIQLISVIYFDGLTHDKFIDNVNKLSDALGLCNIIWKKFIDSVAENQKK